MVVVFSWLEVKKRRRWMEGKAFFFLALRSLAGHGVR